MKERSEYNLSYFVSAFDPCLSYGGMACKNLGVRSFNMIKLGVGLGEIGRNLACTVY